MPPNKSALILNTSLQQLQDNGSKPELDLPEETITKTESTADLLTIFSLQLMVAFKSKLKDGSVSTTTEKGRWCGICK